MSNPCACAQEEVTARFDVRVTYFIGLDETTLEFYDVPSTEVTYYKHTVGIYAGDYSLLVPKESFISVEVSPSGLLSEDKREF